MQQLGHLFGNPARLKAIRLFLFNQGTTFSLSEIALRTKVSPEALRSEILALAKAGLIRKKGTGKNGGWALNRSFEHLAALDAFIRGTTVLKPAAFLARLKKAGSLRLAVLSGFFTGILEPAVDLLVVGDHLSEAALAREIRAIEAEMGREIRYAAFSTTDFRYRLGVYDRLIRDVLDYPHRVLLDKIGL